MQKTLTRYSEKLRKTTFKFFICPAKLIIGITLEIWQLDVLVMKIIYIKKLWPQTRFLPIFWSYCTLRLHCLQKVRSHTKAKYNNFHIINILLLITIYKIVTVTPV